MPDFVFMAEKFDLAISEETLEEYLEKVDKLLTEEGYEKFRLQMAFSMILAELLVETLEDTIE